MIPFSEFQFRALCEDHITVNKKKYSWGTMTVINFGQSWNIPLHPEDINEIAKLNDGDVFNFTDETNFKWKVVKNKDVVEFKGVTSTKMLTIDFDKIK